MNVLVTGGLGFIGSHICERLKKEGFNIIIVDNHLSNKVEKLKIKYKLYDISIEDRKCEEVFKRENIDYVIHLAENVNVERMNQNNSNEMQVNINGLINILELSVKYKVKRLIYPSTIDVYKRIEGKDLYDEQSELDPNSFYGIAKLTNEKLCMKYADKHSLPVSILRISKVYGPRQGVQIDEDYMGHLIEKLITDGMKITYQENILKKDYIYVEDVIDGIYKALTYNYDGILNLNSKKLVGLNEISESLENIKKHSSVCTLGQASGNNDLCYDNSLIKKKLDWVQLYTIEEGLAKTYKWYEDEIESKRESRNKDIKKVKSSHNSYLPYVENLIGFLLVTFLSLATIKNSDINYFDFRLLYIILIGSFYGSKQAIISTVLSIASYVISINYLGRDIISILYDSNTYLTTSFYLLIGYVIGYTNDTKIREIKNSKLHEDVLNEKVDFLNNMLEETILLKNNYSEQILNSDNGLGKISRIVNMMDCFSIEELYINSIVAMEDFLKAENIGIYILSSDKQYARLVSSSSGKSEHIKNSIDSTEINKLISELKDEDMYINRELDKNLPAIATTIKVDHEIIGIISIYNLDFEYVNLYNLNLIRIITSIISTYYKRIKIFNEAFFDNMYLEDTKILQHNSLKSIIKHKEIGKDTLGINFEIYNVIHDKEDIITLYNNISKLLRETDYLGMSENGNLLFVLSNFEKNYSDEIRKRFNSIGYNLIRCVGVE